MHLERRHVRQCDICNGKTNCYHCGNRVERPFAPNVYYIVKRGMRLFNVTMNENRSVEYEPIMWSDHNDLDEYAAKVFSDGKTNQVLFTSSVTFADLFDPNGNNPIEDVAYSGQVFNFKTKQWNMIVGVKYANEE